MSVMKTENDKRPAAAGHNPQKEKTTMKKKTATLTVVKDEQQARLARLKRYADLEIEERQWRITSQQVRDKVHTLRLELESCRQQLEAVPYDLADEMPLCLQSSNRKDQSELSEELNPLITHLFERCDSVAQKYGVGAEMDYNAQLFALKQQLAETSFRVGLLAGVMFSGASNETIDRFERGLIYSLTANRQICRGRSRN